MLRTGSIDRLNRPAQFTSHKVIEYNMAQSAIDSSKYPLHIDAFWEEPTITPPLSWDKWTQQRKLVLMAKEGIQFETLLNGPTPAVTYPPEPIYDEPV